MNKGRRARRLIDIAGMAIALGIMFELQNFWAGLLAANVIFIITYAVSEWAFPDKTPPDEAREERDDKNQSGPWQ
jgi:uncharacterized membrane protein